MKLNWVVTVFAAMLFSYVAKSEEKAMTAKADILRSTFGMGQASETIYSHTSNAPLSSGKFHKVGDMDVAHSEHFDAAKQQAEDTITFKSQDGKLKAYAKVTYCKAPAEARQIFYERLVETSMPLESYIKGHQVWKDGPGELCIVAGRFDVLKQEIGAVKFRLYFLRGNVVVKVASADANTDVRDLGVILDKKLVGTQ